jgi:hypothetical protein
VGNSSLSEIGITGCSGVLYVDDRTNQMLSVACCLELVSSVERHFLAALLPGPLVCVEPGFDAAITSGEVGLMAESAAPSSGRIFISYRREETAYPAGWLYDRLIDRYGGQVFKDVDSIELGDDFVEVITRAVGSCDVLLALSARSG